MTKQEALDIIVEGCSSSSSAKINVPRKMVAAAGCGQFASEGTTEYVEVDREALLASIQPKKVTKSGDE
jgi:hypothetical protein